MEASLNLGESPSLSNLQGCELKIVALIQIVGKFCEELSTTNSNSDPMSIEQKTASLEQLIKEFLVI